ncbi:alpha/beta hydrolase [Mucilaginibacter limnophilus]|uniref:Alpha/beta hydrolase n=1 Tax=Mucilaginibacter limnophilus TaxID=1932778 RepID=A0A3S2XYU8_9SPHI|nr:alpha/beta hydrolase [Mucilaginibacter limnophilus]RVT98217.1 alpha/beta hydrolase [Mucilaginibacter limnophilus]
MKYKYLFALLFISLSACGQQPATNLQTTNGKFVNIRGFKMYYEIYGEGEPLLMIHGNGGSTRAFDKQIPYFSKKYKVIVADSRAQGKSTDPTDSLSYEMMADDLNALLDTLKIKQAYVIGWSDGGINSLLLAIRHPDKVKKLAATGANLVPDTTGLVPYVYNDIAKTDKMLLRSMKTSGRTFSLKNAYKVNHLMVLHPHITAAQLHTIKVPALIINGDHDAIPVKHAVEIAESIPNSYLWILPNSGHSTLVNYKDEFNKTVDDFFSKPFRKIEGGDRYN